MTFHPLEHTILSRAKQKGIDNRNLVVAVSGGADSMALLHILAALRPVLKNKIIVAHVHHGESENRKFRNAAMVLVQNTALKLGLVSYAFIHQGATLKTENEMRIVRYDFLKKLAAREDAVLVTAHHLNDLLETRMMRLVRGTGVQGMQAISEYKNKKWRPFLTLPQSEVLAYARDKKLKYLTDPSNRGTEKSMRNWLRHSWLPQLEKKTPGTVARLGRSLEIVANHAQALRWKNDFISRQTYLGLSPEEKSQLVAYWLHKVKKQGYTSGQIQEVIRRLDSPRNEHTFKLLGVHWTIDNKSIRILDSI